MVLFFFWSTTICADTDEEIELIGTARNLWGYENYSDFQWYRDDLPIAGATDSTYLATTPGTYTLRGYYSRNNTASACYSAACCSYTVIYN